MRHWILSLFLLLACGPKPETATTASQGTPPAVLPAENHQVSFASLDGLMLEGVLRLPERTQGVPVPGVVLMHGSGPNSRDAPMAGQLNMGFGFEIEVLKELSKGLADRGVAVLRYDKRSCFGANGCDNDYPVPSDDILVQDFMDDGVAALAFLAEQTEVDVARRYVVGHSQGASFIPQMLTDDPELAGGVMLAGGYEPIDALVAFQYTSSVDLMVELGTPQATIDAQTAVLAQWVAELESLRAGTYEGDTLMGVSTAFWEDWFRITDAAPEVAQTVTQPMWALSGDYDWNVPPSQTELWAAQFEGTAHTATLLPCVTHALNCVTQPDWQAITPKDLGTEVDVQVLDALEAAIQ